MLYKMQLHDPFVKHTKYSTYLYMHGSQIKLNGILIATTVINF